MHRPPRLFIASLPFGFACFEALAFAALLRKEKEMAEKKKKEAEAKAALVLGARFQAARCCGWKRTPSDLKPPVDLLIPPGYTSTEYSCRDSLTMVRSSVACSSAPLSRIGRQKNSSKLYPT